MDMTLEALTEKRDELMKRLADIRKDLRSGLDADSKEQAIELENLEVLQEIARVAEDDLGRVNQQISALEKGA
jgi:hypothetical protein